MTLFNILFIESKTGVMMAAIPAIPEPCQRQNACPVSLWNLSLIIGEDVYKRQILEHTGCSVEELTHNKVTTLLSQKAENGHTSCAGLVKDLENRLKTRLILEEYQGTGLPESPKAAADTEKITKEILEAVKKGKKEDYELLLARLLHSCRDMTYEAFSNTILNADVYKRQ